MSEVLLGVELGRTTGTGSCIRGQVTPKVLFARFARVLEMPSTGIIKVGYRYQERGKALLVY